MSFPNKSTKIVGLKLHLPNEVSLTFPLHLSTFLWRMVKTSSHLFGHFTGTGDGKALVVVFPRAPSKILFPQLKLGGAYIPELP
jgi:hypothetical protein